MEEIYKGEYDYFNSSLSNEEDIFDVLNIIDAIKEYADKGNDKAITVILDFEELFLRNDVCREYYSILTGKKGYKVDDCGKSIIELVAERLNLPKEQCEDILKNSIKEMAKENKEIWSYWVKKYYKGKRVTVKKSNPSPPSLIPDSSFYQVDFNRKYVVNNRMYNELEYPSDLQELINVQKKNKDKLDELEQIKKDKKITKEQREELTKRTKFNIDISKDISILKRHYNIEVKNTNNRDRIEFVSYHDLFNDEESDFDIVEKINIDNIIDDWQVQKIKDIASKVLTKKQLIIFNLYYVSELTQQQIADIIGDDQRNITNDLKRIIKKIQKNL